MKNIIIVSLVSSLVLNFTPAFGYLYHCPSMIPDRNHTGDAEMWPNRSSTGNGSGDAEFLKATFNVQTGDSACIYKITSGPHSRGNGTLTLKGNFLKPIIDDSTKWKPSLDKKEVTCIYPFNLSCPLRLKSS